MTEGVAHTHVRRGDSQDESSDSRSPSPLGKFPNPDEDEVLYRKNNVQLKYPASARRRDSSRGGSQSDIHIPGFLFITTRGSNFGSTLILNWAPNSSMRVPSSESTGGTSSASDASDSGFDAADRPSCSSVSIDLGLMEIIRIFYHADESGYIISGEMVIRSKDRTFKVFHFKNGGLNDLIQLFRSWKLFNHQCHKESHQHTFTIFRPKLSLSELHPEEGSMPSVLTEDMWWSLMDQAGRIMDSRYVLRVIFFQGISPSLRKEVWPFLLELYRFDSSERERARVRKLRHDEYWAINDERHEPNDQGFELSVIQQIDKDVVRTDRSNPYYRGEDNQHIQTLKNILLNYLKFKPHISYSQGMTDLLAPLLAALDDEADAFWCFTRLVEGSAFFKPAQNHVSVEKQLEPLRMLINMLIPSFYSYLEQTEGGLSLMFCHRWLLVCLKREFTEDDALSIWEACWTNYQTTSFHLFICVAIMAIYGQKAVDRGMNINELMVFFNTLSQSMPRDIVLSQARGYLHRFCTSPQVNCCLSSVMSKDFWERPGSPELSCSLCKGLTSCVRTEYPLDREAVC